jgi:hypothetical protein
VVTIRDDQLLVLERGRQQVDSRRIADLPHPVQNPIFVRDFDLRQSLIRPLAEQELVGGAGRVRIQHEDLPEVRARGPQQVQPVGFWLGQRLLMPEDHSLAVVAELAQSNKSAALPHHAGLSGQRELLRIGEDTWLPLLRQDAGFPPGGKVAGSLRIQVAALVKQLRQPQNDANQIVGTALVIGLLHGRRDLVVGLRDHVLRVHLGRVIAQRAKGIDTGHRLLFHRFYPSGSRFLLQPRPAQIRAMDVALFPRCAS